MEQLEASPVTVGLVITLRQPVSASKQFIVSLAARYDLSVGRSESHWFGAAACTEDPRALHRALEAEPEISQVDVVFVQLTESPSVSTPSA
jgi:hypothetical protein